MRYRQLTERQRYQIEVLVSLKKSRSEIAFIIGVHRSTVYREIKRNSLKVWREPNPIYEAVPAQGITEARRLDGAQGRRKVKAKVLKYVRRKLMKDWSASVKQPTRTRFSRLATTRHPRSQQSA